MNRFELSRAARTARDIFKGKQTTRVVVRAGEVLVQATDGEVWYEARISTAHHSEARISTPPRYGVEGSSGLVAKHLHKRGVPDPDAFQLVKTPFLPPDGDTVASAEIDRAFLLSVVHAACADEVRAWMCGAHVRGNEGVLEALATDGWRGAIASRDCAEPFAPVTVPTRLVRALGEYCPGEVTVEHGPGFVRLLVERRGIVETLTALPVDGEFPSLNQVFECEYVAAGALVDRARLLDAVPRVGATTDKGHARIGFNESCERVFVYDRGPDHDVVYRVPMRNASGRETVNVSAEYLVEALGSVQDEWVELQILRPRREKELRDAIERMRGRGPDARVRRLEDDLAALRETRADAVGLRTQDGSWRAIIMAMMV